MQPKVRVPLFLLACAFSLFLLPMCAQATTVNVNCNDSDEGPTHSIGKALKKLDPEGPNTINVSGSCKENILIQGFGRLTLNANPGASINDASGGAGTVVDIEDSADVTLQGFTINGGDIGVFCGDFSQCRFKNNTIQNATPSVTGDGYGVGVGRSRATFNGDVLQLNGNHGLNVANGSVAYAVNLQVNSNSLIGVSVGGGSTFTGDPATIQNNGRAGVHVTTHSTFNLLGGNITGNMRSGVVVDAAAEASISSFDATTTISGNSGNGVEIHDLSFAVFVNGFPPFSLSVTGNTTGPDVNCVQVSFSARGATTDIGGGTTNCTEPL
jgi:hypothetical protein